MTLDRKYDPLNITRMGQALLSEKRHFTDGISRIVGRMANVGRRDFLKGSLASVSLATLLPACSTSSDGEVTRIYSGGTILTIDPDFSEAEAIAFQGNTILAVGSLAEVQVAAGDGAEMIDLAGKTMVPGFVDPHAHPMSGALFNSLTTYVGVARFTTADEVLAELAALVAQAEPGAWVMARNYDPSLQTGPDALTFAELDAVSTDNPIFVLNASGHIAYANRKAFELANIGEDVLNPEGAEYSRDSEGRLTGVMKNHTAYLPVVFANPAAADSDPAQALIALAQQWAAKGLTAMADLSFGGTTSGPGDVPILMAAAQSGQLACRIRAYALSNYEDAWTEVSFSDDPGLGDDLVKINGLKMVADGSNQGYTGLQREPYLNSTDRGLAYDTVENMTRVGTEWGKKGWLLSIHGNGDAGIDNVLDAYEQMQANGVELTAARARIEHCSILHDEQIARMKELGVSASFLIGHVYYWGVAMRDDVFGEAKASLLDRCKSVEDAGINYTLHSDFFVTDPDPLHMMEIAVTRRTRKEPEYRLGPDEAVSVESALKAVTINGAWQMGSENEIGSLEVGKLADYVILGSDPRSVDPDTIKDIAVLETWMDGKQVYAA
jgi:predicted amidohydrolase YtcJ